MKNIIRKTKL